MWWGLVVRLMSKKGKKCLAETSRTSWNSVGECLNLLAPLGEDVTERRAGRSGDILQQDKRDTK